MLKRRDVDRSILLSRRRSLWRASFAGLVLFAPLLLTSCGAEVYEQRLENTKKLFSHMELLDAQLQRDWADGDVGVRLRVPLQFATLASSSAGSGKSLGSDQGAAGAVADARQPQYMNIELPGLRGAFVAKLKIIAANAAAASEDGYIYVLTNHHLANAGDRASGFFAEVVALLSQTLRVPVNPGDERQERFPRADGAFAQVVNYRTIVLNPVEPVSGVERQFTIYMHEQSGIQTVVLFVLPKDVDGSERLTDRIPLCLETLRVTGEKLAPPAAGSGPAKADKVGF